MHRACEVSFRAQRRWCAADTGLQRAVPEIGRSVGGRSGAAPIAHRVRCPHRRGTADLRHARDPDSPAVDGERLRRRPARLGTTHRAFSFRIERLVGHEPTAPRTVAPDRQRCSCPRGYGRVGGRGPDLRADAGNDAAGTIVHQPTSTHHPARHAGELVIPGWDGRFARPFGKPRAHFPAFPVRQPVPRRRETHRPRHHPGVQRRRQARTSASRVACGSPRSCQAALNDGAALRGRWRSSNQGNRTRSGLGIA